MMDHREKAYKQFRFEFDLGLQEIAGIDQKSLPDRERNRQVSHASTAAIDRLLETKFGRKLAADQDLEWINRQLEDGLRKIANELKKAASSDSLRSAALWADQCEAERRFKFLGGIGRLFFYFRDGPKPDGPAFLDTRSEEVVRQSLRDAATQVINQADSLFFHITAELMYDSDVVLAIRKLADDAFQLRAKLARSPIDRRNGANPFHDGGDTIIVRQFSQAVCLLCFEVYGWVNAKLLTCLLEMKASTADAYGMPQWLVDVDGAPIDRERRLRKFIAEACKEAQKKTKNRDWKTREMISFYSKYRKRFTEPDGLAL